MGCANRAHLTPSGTTAIGIAFSSALNDDFDSVKVNCRPQNPSRTICDVHGLEGASPAFRYCHIWLETNERWLYCERFSGPQREPTTSRLRSAVNSSVPQGYRESDCGRGEGMGGFCKEWKKPGSPDSPWAALLNGTSDGGGTAYIFELHVPNRS